VARAAGVSQSTVSLVFRGVWAGRVAPSTVVMVRQIAEQLGYRPNAIARRLRLGQTRTILLVVPTLRHPFYGGVYDGAARVAGARGYEVVVYLWRDGVGTARSPFAAVPGAIDGILTSSMSATSVAEIAANGIPLVMLDSDPADSVPTVNLDLVSGFRDLVCHLAGLGHRDFGHVASGVDTWTFHARHAAIAEAVTAVPGARLRVAQTTMDVASARRAAEQLLTAAPRPTALICDDDVLATGAYKAVRGLGLKIPRDVSVTGFGDDPVAEALDPELTTVRLPEEEIGAHGMSALLELLEGTAPVPVSLPGTLIIRASTKAP
jgi:LacI family transcriptional regulator